MKSKALRNFAQVFSTPKCRPLQTPPPRPELTTAVIPVSEPTGEGGFDGIQSRRGYRIAGRPGKTIKRKEKYKNKSPWIPACAGMTIKTAFTRSRASNFPRRGVRLWPPYPLWPPVSDMSIPVVAICRGKHRGLGQARGPVPTDPSQVGYIRRITKSGPFQQPRTGRRAVDFTGFRIDPRRFLSEDEENNRQTISDIR